ncbi:MAG: hypothetical protein COA94_08395 [Rickettsiales bacterium]|nr:MAG: hypothetical protein COA94_08395 [Rickettsiales bacterium]
MGFQEVFRDVDLSQVDLSQLEAIGLDRFIEIAGFVDINIEGLDQIRLLHLLLENNDRDIVLSLPLEEVANVPLALEVDAMGEV